MTNQLNIEPVSYSIISKTKQQVSDLRNYSKLVEILYKGSSEFEKYKSLFIPRKPNEPMELYDYRLSLSSYDNLLNHCTDSLLNKFTDVSFTVEGLPNSNNNPDSLPAKYWSRIRKNLDGKGLSEREFFQNLLLKLIKHKKVALVYSLTNEPTGNLRDDYLKGVQPKIDIYSSHHLLDYGINKYGGYDYVKIGKVFTRSNPLAMDEFFVSWEIYTPDSYMRFELPVEPDGFGHGRIKNTELTELDICDYKVECVASYNHGFPAIPVKIVEIDSSKWLAHKAFSLEKSRILISNHANFVATTVAGIEKVITPLTYKEGFGNEGFWTKGFWTKGFWTKGFGDDDFGLYEDYRMVETNSESIRVLQEREQALTDTIRDLMYNSSISNSRHRVSQESGKAKMLDSTPLTDYLTAMGAVCCETLESIYKFFSLILGDSELAEGINITGLNQFNLTQAEMENHKTIVTKEEKD